MFENWKRKMGGVDPLFPEMRRIQVVRSFLFNPLYHQCSEMVVNSRSTGNKVPDLYGLSVNDWM